MEVEFDDTKNHEFIEQMKNIGYDFNWQNEGGNLHMAFYLKDKSDN